MVQTQCLNIHGGLEDVKLNGVGGTLEGWFLLRAWEATLNPSLSRDWLCKLLKHTLCPFVIYL